MSFLTCIFSGAERAPFLLWRDLFALSQVGLWRDQARLWFVQGSLALALTLT